MKDRWRVTFLCTRRRNLCGKMSSVVCCSVWLELGRVTFVWKKKCSLLLCRSSSLPFVYNYCEHRNAWDRKVSKLSKDHLFFTLCSTSPHPSHLKMFANPPHRLVVWYLFSLLSERYWHIPPSTSVVILLSCLLNFSFFCSSNAAFSASIVLFSLAVWKAVTFMCTALRVSLPYCLSVELQTPQHPGCTLGQRMPSVVIHNSHISKQWN